ncbi:MAG: hypothetical protein JWM44_533 [Bacilli bacterium]|nr:hypothetical protein [Bacilli bacterium]
MVKGHTGKLYKSLERKEGLTAYLFILPFLLLFLVFQIIPIFSSFLISFVNFNSFITSDKFSSLKFVGFQNFATVFKDQIAVASFGKSFYFSAVYVISLLVTSLVLAVALNRKIYFKAFSRTVMLMPYVSNIVAISIIFNVIFSPYDGPINAVLKGMGIIHPPMWLVDSTLSLPMAALIASWHSLAFQIIVFLAALQSVPAEMYESATIDGANGWRKFTSITLPMISPTTFFLITTSLIRSFQNYDLIRNLTNGGPGVDTKVVAFNIYEEAFLFGHFSKSAAEAVLLFVIIMVITAIQWGAQKKWVHY